jgi:hypothetical protein
MQARDGLAEPADAFLRLPSALVPSENALALPTGEGPSALYGGVLRPSEPLL